MKKVLLIIGIIVSALICIANLVCAIIYRGTDCANIFTAVSGLISGIATLFVGLIAYNQSKQYTLMTQKTEFMNKIEAEKKEFLSQFLIICKVNKYTDIFIQLSNDLKLNTSLLSHQVFYFKLSEVRDDLINYCNMIQTYWLIPENIKPLFTECNNMLQFVLRQFDLKDKYTLKEDFINDIQNSTMWIIEWIDKMHLLKRKCSDEYYEHYEKVRNANSLNALTEIRNHINTKIKNIRDELSNEKVVE
jgi:hypothetical protein